LFLYGPKSTGKTTLINKVIKKLDTEVFSISFISMRAVLIRDFKDFKNFFFPPTLKGKIKDILSGIHFNLGFFGWNIEDEKLLEENIFSVMISKLRKANKLGKKPVIIIDEFQYLRGIPLDKENNLSLVQELWKLFIEITKVYNLAHVVCLTSDSYYMEELYTDNKLVNTSDFQLINHLSKEDIYYWLGNQENCPKAMIDDIWDNLGGNVWEIWQVFVSYKNNDDWKPKLKDLLQVKYSYIIDYYDEILLDEWKNKFLEVTEGIVKNGKYVISRGEKLLFLVKDLVSRDYWFYDTKTKIITANSKSLEKGMESLLKEIKNQ
jgi:AAA+ ATPase superfamily predicted ATPase